MAITASRTTLGMDREVNSEAASQRARRSLLNKGYRQARKEKDYGKALAFSDKMDEQGMPRGTTGSAENVGSLAMGRVASRESLATQMRGQLPALAGQTREGNIAAAKRSGTFDATRSAYNEKAGAFGKQMDEQGNIAATPPVAGAKPVAGAGAGAGAGATPRQALLNSPAMPPSKVSAPGGLMTPPSAAQLNAANPQTPPPAMTPQTADQIKAGQTPTPTIEGTGLPELPKAKLQEEGQKLRSDASAGSQARAPEIAKAARDTAAAQLNTRGGVNEIDPLLVNKRGFDTPDNSAEGNIEFRPLPDAQAEHIRTVKGRGSDGMSRALQVANPFMTYATLKQGGKSDLPPSMGARAEYANANDRLKGDSDAITAAQEQGLLRTRRVKDQFGESKVQVLAPVVRGTNKSATEYKKARKSAATTLKSKPTS